MPDDDYDVRVNWEPVGRFKDVVEMGLSQYLEPSDCYVMQRVSSSWNTLMRKNVWIRKSIKAY